MCINIIRNDWLNVTVKQKYISQLTFFSTKDYFNFHMHITQMTLFPGGIIIGFMPTILLTIFSFNGVPYEILLISFKST